MHRELEGEREREKGGRRCWTQCDAVSQHGGGGGIHRRL